MACCGICGLAVKTEKAHLHEHLPDTALVVSDGYAYFAIHDGTKYVPLNYNLPEEWLEFLFWCGGGSITLSGSYSLPQIFRELCWAVGRGALGDVRAIERQINKIVQSWRR